MMNIEVKLLQGQQLFREKFINAVCVPPINAVGVYEERCRCVGEGGVREGKDKVLRTDY
jgi:hypothetical protein